MTGGHERFEELAVGHVLGGLDQNTSADFRTHLVGCRDCRLRVAELRGIAADLVAAEREERALAATKTQQAVRRESDEEIEATASGWVRIPERALQLGIVFGAVVLLGLGFWNFHLRNNNGQLLATTQVRERILQMLAEGDPVPLTLTGTITGAVVVDGDEFAVNLGGLPTPSDGSEITLWLLGASDGKVRVLPFPSQNLPDGKLAWHWPHYGADELVISIEQVPPSATTPQGQQLVRADLDQRIDIPVLIEPAASEEALAP